MKSLQKTLVVIMLVLATNYFAQSNYYSGTEGLNGSALKAVLHSKIKGHTKKSYSFVRTILRESDRDPKNSSNVILIYTDKSVAGSNSGAWNREHVWAKSHGFPNKSDTAYSDAHHLRPSDYQANSARGNKDFDYGGDKTYEKGVHYDSDSWEPRDEVKGDVARMMFYMTVRYEGGDGYDLELVEYTGTSGAKFGKKSVLLEWNRLDPVSAFERQRNRGVYKYQKNYNPFIDHPEFADRIYNADKLILEAAQAVGGNSLLLTFSKELNTSEAGNIENYNLDVLGTPTKATPNFGGDSKKVVLEFSENFADTFYNVRVSNLLSSSGEKVIKNSIALFRASGITEVDTTAPATPVNLIVTQNDKSILLNWDANSESDISHYTIYKGALPNFTPSQYTVLATTSTNSYSDTEIADYKVYYKISAFDMSGNESDYSDEASILFVGIKDKNILPTEFLLSQNYPNPFNPTTQISFAIPNASQVNISVYNVLGQKVAEIVNQSMDAGIHTVKFDGSELVSGFYFYRLETPSYSKTMKMILVK